MRTHLRLVGLLLSFTCSASAATIEATGRALIENGDLDSARARAISRASEQASMMALAQISVTQSVRDGVLEIDNLRVSSQTKLGAVELLSERRIDNQLEVLIRAEVDAVEGCADNSEATAYRKPLALTQWPILRPAEANVGRVHALSQLLPGYLMAELENSAHLKLIDARQYQLPTYSELSSDAARQRARDAANLNTQYLLTAKIESLAMAKSASDTPNLLLDIAERAGIKPSDTERFFQLSADLIDSRSGEILQRYQLQTQGRWNAPLQSKQGISIERFMQEPYGQAVLQELSKMAQQLSESLACQPLEASILSASGTTLWIDRGADAGLNPGDRLSVARQVQLFDSMMQPVVSTELTDLNFTVERTEFGRAQGRLSQPSDIAGIQPGDIVIGN